MSEVISARLKYINNGYARGTVAHRVVKESNFLYMIGTGIYMYHKDRNRLYLYTFDDESDPTQFTRSTVRGDSSYKTLLGIGENILRRTG